MTFLGNQQPGVPPPTVPSPAGWQLQSSTGGAGFALVNATPNILTWTPPNDGALHRFLILAQLRVGGTAETGGEIALSYTDPGGTANIDAQVFAASLGASSNNRVSFPGLVSGGTSLTVFQFTALTAGGPSQLWAEIWGS
jgi:hypothetical protein